MKDIKPVAWAVSCDLGSGIKGIFEDRDRAMDFCHSVRKTHITPLYAIPEGYVIVPAEPTKAMRAAFHEANDEFEEGENYTLVSPDYQWSAMLKAAQEDG